MTNDEIAASILLHGFLSPAVEDAQRMYREAAPAWFNLAESISQIGQRIIGRAIVKSGESSNDPRVWATFIFIRSMQSFQGALLLTNRGMATEARMIVRSCFENAFCLAALIKDPTKLLKALDDDNKAYIKSQAKFLSKDQSRLDQLDAKARKRINKFASTVDKEWGKTKQLSIDEVAASNNFANAYLSYKFLSNDSVHPSHDSLKHCVTRNGDGWGYIVGPTTLERVTETISVACLAILGVLVAYTEIVEDFEGNKEVADAAESYRQLSGKPK